MSRSIVTPQPGSHPIDTGTVVLRREKGPPEHWLLEVNGVPSSAVCPADPAWLGFEYLEMMRLAIDTLLPARPLEVVHLGAAGCALAWALAHERPGSRQLAVELDAELVRLVRHWFPLPRSPELRLRVGEARAELRTRRADSADVVVRDVFAGDQTPDHVRTVEFCAEVDQVLRPGGWYLANLADRPPLSLMKSEASSAAAVFDTTALIAETSVLRGRRYGNAVLLGGTGKLPAADLTRALARTGLALTVLHGDRLRDFAAGYPPVTDAHLLGR